MGKIETLIFNTYNNCLQYKLQGIKLFNDKKFKWNEQTGQTII